MQNNIHINYWNRNRILTSSSSSALGDFFAFGAEKENNYKKYITSMLLNNDVYKNYTFAHFCSCLQGK
jgi:hypothetical protein